MKTFYTAAVAIIALAGIGFAPIQANAQTPIPNHPRVNQVNKRMANQQARIHQGVKSGQLTRHEATHVKLKDASIKAQERRDRIKHGGHLSTAEQARLNARLNHTSKAIHNKKHNAVVR